MYLLKEGMIFQDTPAAKHVSASDLAKRQKGFTERKRLLESNPNLMISRTRLSVRNLGKEVTAFSLKRCGVLAVKRFWEEVENGGGRRGLEDVVIQEEVDEGREIPGKDRRIVVKQVRK